MQSVPKRLIYREQMKVKGRFNHMHTCSMCAKKSPSIFPGWQQNEGKLHAFDHEKS